MFLTLPLNINIPERIALTHHARKVAAAWDKGNELSPVTPELIELARDHGIPLAQAWNFCAEVVINDMLCLMEMQKDETTQLLAAS